MFNPDRHMSDEDAVQVVLNGKYGVLSTASKDAEPYGVAVNYVYVPGDNALYFHCQLKGRKISNMRENDRVSLFVIGREEIVPERFITHYESAIVTGRDLLHLGQGGKAGEDSADLQQVCTRFPGTPGCGDR